jgi:protein-disulfide isomerase
MKALILAGAAASALLLAGCGGGDSSNMSAASLNAPLKQIPAPQGDWTQVVSETPEGGFRMGNPSAPVKLVEYASLNCPHCAEFAEQGVPKLRDTYVRSGQVSWEFRPYILFGSDPGVSMLLRCQGATPFFRLAEELYATQGEWSTKAQTMTQAQAQQLQAMDPQQAAGALVQIMGLDQFFRQRGMPEAKIRSCLADRAGLEKLTAIKAQADKEGVTGTPTFFLNGTMATETASWDRLEPKLRTAIGQ